MVWMHAYIKIFGQSWKLKVKQLEGKRITSCGYAIINNASTLQMGRDVMHLNFGRKWCFYHSPSKATKFSVVIIPIVTVGPIFIFIFNSVEREILHESLLVVLNQRANETNSAVWLNSCELANLISSLIL